MSDTISFEEVKAITLEETDKAKNIDDLLYRITQRVYHKGKEDAVKRGRWINKLESYKCSFSDVCSECGKRRVRDNFCSSCGADMRGET